MSEREREKREREREREEREREKRRNHAEDSFVPFDVTLYHFVSILAS